MSAARATALFVAGACLPILGSFVWPMEAGWREVGILIAAIAWGVPAFVGGMVFHVLLSRRTSGAAPRLPWAFLFGMLFSGLPLGMGLAAERLEIHPLTGLWLLGILGAGLAAAFAWMTPLRPRT